MVVRLRIIIKKNFSQTSATSWRRSVFILHRNLKRSGIMVDLHDYDIQCIEHEILWKYDKSECDCLLSLRKDMINKRVLVHQKEMIDKYKAFECGILDYGIIVLSSSKNYPLMMEETRLAAYIAGMTSGNYEELSLDDGRDKTCCIHSRNDFGELCFHI